VPVPAVTFVIPCHNHGRFVAGAVRSALAQDEADVHVVVVDDGSDASSAAACTACAGPHVRVIRQENRGLPAARNLGARGATTPYLAFLDADDTVEPGFCAALAGALDSAPAEVSHAYCHERIVGLHAGEWRVPEWDPVMMLLMNLHPVTCLVRREHFERAGGFDESLRLGYEDWDLWLRFVGRGWRGVRVPAPLFNWNRHSDTTMVTGAARRHEAIYRELIGRHRSLYERHALELIARAGGLLRRAEMHWIDEWGEPINLRALQDQRRMYESMAAVRLHNALHRGVARLPGPLAAAVRMMMRGAGALAPRARPESG
jgi:glycosyltransferase involved in cell wall biosynthesis